MNGPGTILQQARKKKKFSLDKVHKLTKIKTEYLEALENNDVSTFPAELYYKNFLKTYAKFLSLDSIEILNLYEQAKKEEQEDLFKQNNIEIIENKFIDFFKTNIKTLIIVLSVIIILIFFIILTVSHNKKFDEQTVKEEIKLSSKISDTASSTSVQEKAVVPVEQSLHVTATQDTWIKIISDNKNVFEGILQKGHYFKSKSKNEFKIKIGNVDTVTVLFNNTPVDIVKGSNNSKVNTITLKRD